MTSFFSASVYWKMRELKKACTEKNETLNLTY